jgi:hypothetical protein
MYSFGRAKRCQVSTLAFYNMRSRLIRMLDLFDNVLELLILGRSLILRKMIQVDIGGHPPFPTGSK